MILHVCDRVKEAGLDLAVATDDQRIFDKVTDAGYRAVMTSANHSSGTDRVWEAYGKLSREYRVVINVQGDEPFIATSQLRALARCFDDPQTDIATLVRPFPADYHYSRLVDPNLVKVVTDGAENALLFSRQPIPYLRGIEKDLWPKSYTYLTHVGIYGYRPEVLKAVTSLQRSPLEIGESLEQLRWLQAGYRIRTAVTREQNVGIDTPEDLAEAEKLLKAKMAMSNQNSN